MLALPIEEIAALCRRYGVNRLWVFGSAVTEKFDSVKSDVDFLVEYRPETNLGPWLGDYFDLKEAFELLLGRTVDLIERQAIKNPYFLRNIASQERLVFAA